MTLGDPFVSEPRSNVLAWALEWLRSGYPAGMPRQDYVVLLGLVQRKLTEVEVHEIADVLAEQVLDGQQPLTSEEIEALIRESAL